MLSRERVTARRIPSRRLRRGFDSVLESAQRFCGIGLHDRAQLQRVDDRECKVRPAIDEFALEMRAARPWLERIDEARRATAFAAAFEFPPPGSIDRHAGPRRASLASGDLEILDGLLSGPRRAIDDAGNG